MGSSLGQRLRGRDYLHLHLSRRRYQALTLLHTWHANEAFRSGAVWHFDQAENRGTGHDRTTSRVRSSVDFFSMLFSPPRRWLSVLGFVVTGPGIWSVRLAVPFQSIQLMKMKISEQVATSLHRCLSQKCRKTDRLMQMQRAPGPGQRQNNLQLC